MLGRPLTAVAFFWFACGAAPAQGPPQRTQVRFVGPAGMQVRWLVQSTDGKSGFSDPPLEAPARCNFHQGGVYRLKLSNIRGFPGLDVYPTLEVRLVGPAIQEFLAHNAVSLEFSDEDFRQALDGKHVTKTIHGPGPGSIVLVVRMGNIDLETPGAGDE